MENKEIKQNIKLGIFVLVGLLLFLISIFYISSENNIFNPTFSVLAVFKNVEGLKRGDNVWLSGVKVGTVRGVHIVSEGSVIVELSLQEDQSRFIKTDATAFVGTDGLVGNKIVVIRPGNAAVPISDADTINSISPADTQDILNLAREVGQNTRAITEDLREVIENINKGKGVVGELLSEGELAADLREAISSLRTAGTNAAHVTSNLNGLVYDLQHGDGLLPTLISDTSYQQTFTQAIANIKNVSESAAAMADNLEDVISKVNNENNALGVLLSDTIFARKLQRTIDNAQDASAKLDENMEALQHNFLFRGYFRKKERQEEAN